MWSDSKPPDDIRQFVQDNEQDADENERFLGRVDEIGFDVAVWKASLFKTLTNLDEAISQGRKLDARLTAWAAESEFAPEICRHEVVYDPSADPVGIWNGQYLAFKDIFVAGTWTTYCLLRISVNRLMNYLLKKSGQQATSPDRVKVTEHRAQMCDEICAAAPWRFGYGGISPRQDTVAG